MENVIIPIVIGLVQIGKGAGISSRLAPILSLASGIILALVAGIDAPVISGLIFGLSASGLYAGTKATFK